MVQLSDGDRGRILEYVGLEAEVNLFFIGDIENFGVDCPEVSVFAANDAGHWDSLVLRYINDYVVYSRDADYDAGRTAHFLQTHNAHIITGKASIIKGLVPFFPGRSLRIMHLARCAGIREQFAASADVVLRRLMPADAAIMAELMLLIDLYTDIYHDKETATAKISTNLTSGGTAFGVFRDGDLVSCAQTTAANSQSAMVSGVATHPGARGRGYASAAVSELCRDAFSSGKTYLCLFYDNPDAGRIYARIGFEPAGQYAIFQ